MHLCHTAELIVHVLLNHVPRAFLFEIGKALGTRLRVTKALWYEGLLNHWQMDGVLIFNGPGSFP